MVCVWDYGYAGRVGRVAGRIFEGVLPQQALDLDAKAMAMAMLALDLGGKRRCMIARDARIKSTSPNA